MHFAAVIAYAAVSWRWHGLTGREVGLLTAFCSLQLLGVGRRGLGVGTLGVQVHVGRGPDPATEELVHGHPGPLAGDVPQGHVDPRECVVADGPFAPVRGDRKSVV